MQQNYPFQPRGGANSTASLAVGTTAAPVVFAGVIPAEGVTVRLVNGGSQVVFLSFSGTATLLAGMPMIPNSVETFSLPPGSVISAIAAATGSTLYATLGDGC